MKKSPTVKIFFLNFTPVKIGESSEREFFLSEKRFKRFALTIFAFFPNRKKLESNQQSIEVALNLTTNYILKKRKKISKSILIEIP